MNNQSAEQDAWLRLLSRLSIDVALESLLLVLLGYAAIRGLHWAAELYLRRYERHALIVRRAIRLVELCIWVVIVPAGLLRILRPDQQLMLAVLGAGAVAAGFALKDLVAGVVASVVIALDRPFDVGDYIEIRGYAGEVVSIGLRSTTIVSLDDNTITIPNAVFLSEAVSNANAGKLSCMVVTDFYLAHEVDYETVKTILWEAAVTSKYVAVDRPVVVVSQELPYGTKFSVKAYVADHRDMVRFASDVAESAKREFQARGIPYARVRYAEAMW